MEAKTSHLAERIRATLMEVRVDLKEMMRRFLIFEKENDLFTLQIKGNYFWDYIRDAVFNEMFLFNPQFGILDSHFKDGRRHYMRYVKEVLLYFIFFWRRSFIPKKHYDLIVVNYNRVELIDGKNVNKTTYPLISQLKRKYKILAIDPALLGQEAEVSENYGCDVLLSRSFHVWDKIKAALTLYSPKEKILLREIDRKLETVFNIKINVPHLTKREYSYQLQQQKRFLGIFRDHRPRAVICANDGNSQGIVAAARELGIHAIDAQHAMVSYVKILCNYPDNIDKRYAPGIPDSVLTFGDYWNREYRLPITTISVGFPYFEIMRKRVLSANGLKEGKNILIISDPIARQKFIQCALELSHLLPNYKIYYKLMQLDYKNWRSRYPREFIENPNIVVVDHNNPTLYEYFTRCSYLIATHSTAFFEGLGFGLTGFVLRELWSVEMEGLCAQGYAFLVSSASEIAEKIVKNIKPLNVLDDNLFFKKESLRNIEKAMASVLATVS